MSVRISLVDEQESGRTILRVEGALRLEDAELLENPCRDLREQAKRNMVVDLSGLTFLDSDSASVLCRLEARPEITLTGLHLFTRQMIEGHGEQARGRDEEGDFNNER
jgi:anti-anti-sigma regulatory factor